MKKALLFSLIGLIILSTGHSALSTGLTNYYAFEETSGTVVTDSTGNYDGINYLSAIRETGLIGKAYKHNGSTYVNFTGTGDYVSASIWIKNDASADNGNWLGIGTEDDLGLRLTAKTAGTDIGFKANNNQIHTGLINYNNWLHVVIAFENSTAFKLYFNGVFNKTFSGLTITKGGALVSGVNVVNNNQFAKGWIDELGTWNRTLTSAEVTELWNEGAGITYTDIVPETIINYNVTSIYDNSTSHLFEYNTQNSLNFTGHNITGLTPQELNIWSDDASGLDQNETSNVAFDVVFSNETVTNYSIIVTNPYNLSITKTFYFIINDVKNINYTNTTSLFKYNTTQSLNFTMELDDNTISFTDTYNLTIPSLSINNRLVTSGELTNINFNNSLVYNYTAYLTNERFGRTINNTYYFYTVDSTLNNSFNNMTNGFTSTITTTRTDGHTYPYTFKNYLTWNNTYQTITGTNPFTTTIGIVDITPLLNETINIQSITQVSYLGTTLNITQNDTQYIFRLDIDNCTIYSTKFLKLIGKDEITGNDLNVDVNINFEYNGNKIYNTSYGGTVNYEFCYSPGEGTYKIDAEIEYEGSLSTYSEPRDYFLRNFNINDVENNINLYCLQDNESALLEFTVEDDVGIGLNDYYVQFNKWSIATSSYSTVSNTITNDNGEGSTYINFFDTWYQIIISDSSGLIVKNFTKQKFTSSPVIFPITGGVGVEYNYWSNCFTSNVYFSNSTRLVATVINTCGLNTELNLSVTRMGILTNTIICNTQLTGASSFTTYCDIINSTGNLYQATVNALIDDTIIQLYNEYLDYNIISDNYNGSGLFTTFMMIGVLSSIGILVSGSVGALFGILGLVASYMLGFVVLTWTSIIGIMIILILVLVVLKK